jgi:LmbE family N-acetylglucosaminyl deacetylase
MVRERELWAAAAELGAQHAQVLAYPDGDLQSYRISLGDAIADIMRQFDPDTVVTFGPDGGYGHPDHIAVSELTTATFRGLVRHHSRGQRLYHAVFPPRRTSMAEELAHWITRSGPRTTDCAALQAITLFARETTTLRLSQDDVRVEWFPPGMGVIEQGERAEALYLILNGTADALLEQPDGQVTWLRRMGAGEFFGELGLLEGKRTAHVVAGESLTCLVLARTPIRPYHGRGPGATTVADLPATDMPLATSAIDVTSYLHRKLGALARHRTQYPTVPSMLPHSLLQKMLGTEFFCRAASGRSNGALSRTAEPRPHGAQRTPVAVGVDTGETDCH